MSTSIYDFSATDINGNLVELSKFRNKVLLIVNTASKCGFTGQYAGLEKLYTQFHNTGLEILAFPCNQFMNQEPGDAEEIKNFCSLNYNVTFPLFAKIDVNGENTHPLYKFLKKQASGILNSEAIKWNFTKFLVSRDGQTITRHAPTVSPEDLKVGIESLLKL